MIATEYQPLARRTLKELPREQHFLHMALGLCGEIGEFIDAVKKHVIYGKDLDKVNLTEETGDDFWYAANLLPELGVSPVVFQRALDKGQVEGAKIALAPDTDTWTQAKLLLQLNLGIAGIGNVLATTPERFEEGGSESVRLIEALGGILGTLCGLFLLDPALAMDLNIKKLAKRYGDKYSDVAALNRDLGAERAVLEQKDEPQAAPIHIDWHRFLAIGRERCKELGHALYGDNQLPWSFSFTEGGVMFSVTHENDTMYLLAYSGSYSARFRPGDLLVIEKGEARIEPGKSVLEV